MKISKKTVSGKFLEVTLYSKKSQLVHVRIINFAGISKLSVWEVIEKGDNIVTINISTLAKGPYKIILDFAEENSKEDIFAIS
ncbi:MAG TPA: hypothetical protein VNW06_02475 [Cytophagaceae bacterium]|jgi:hypothetical protein|nr:hypothetical protein [Cytophagaceae bacterium]